ncbi:MAG TPA: DUF1540 domain-containing protein [Polyangiaceae bacterium]|nr:DUF1540 domain-containing protein [Polyangiaceae bacterium]
MKVMVTLAEVSECSARECAFNDGGQCHAQAITVGDAVQPICDTFLAATEHSHRPAHAGVGACKVTSCRHNEAYGCAAEAIRVWVCGDSAQCSTYAVR